MKAVLFSLAFALGLFFGFYPSLHKPRPLYWRIMTITILTLTVILALLPHTAGTFGDAIVSYRRMGSERDIPVKVKLLADTKIINKESHQISFKAIDFTNNTLIFTVLFNDDRTDLDQLTSASSAIILLHREGVDNVFRAGKTVVLNPTLTLPYILALEERARILYFHVPMSWIATLAYIVAMIYAGMYLRRKNIRDDITSSSAAALGTLFCLLATVTGSIWAKFNWGEFWNWDPKETSIFVLLLIYAAYFALRASIENEERRARLSAVYAILAAITVPFFLFILPRITKGLHPGSSDDVNAGAVISPQADALNSFKQIILSLSFAGFTLLFFWMLSLQIRLKTITMKLLERHNSNNER
jgi:heme exporter protein C